MKYIIYGLNRVALDFTYIFDDMEISRIVDDDVQVETMWGYNVCNFSELTFDCTSERIIICDYDNTKKEEKLQSIGLKYKDDYLFAEDYFDRLDSFAVPKDKKIAIWGTGNMANRLMQEKLSFEPEIFIDSNKDKDIFYGKKVHFPEEVEISQYFIIIAIAKSTDIRNLLEQKGMLEGRDFCSFHMILGQPSQLLKKTIFDQSYYELECHTMLNHLEVLNGGATRCCCTTFVSQDMDNVLSGLWQEVWKSNVHKVMCLSIENRTYTFCDKNMCPLFVDKCRYKREASNLPIYKYKRIKDFPEVLALGYDPSCNLACATCRKSVYYAKGQDKERIRKITEVIKKDYLSKCKFLILAGDGEVFASPYYKLIYEDECCNPEYIRLLTNGTLFTPINWERLKRGKHSKIMMTVSIDAASPETYKLIRCNGNFEILKQNMEFAAALRKSGELAYLRFNFVVQRNNYLEMIPFTEWGESLGVDEVFFTKILNWGTYTQEEFAEISMMQEDGITPKPELEKVLNSSIIRNSQIVDLGTIQYSHKIDEVGIVDNYYMWELEKRGGNLFQ